MVAKEHEAYKKRRCDNSIDQMFLDMQSSISVCLALFILS